MTLQPDRKLPPAWRWARLEEVCDEHIDTRDPRAEPDSPFRYVDITSVDNTAKRILDAKTLVGRDAPSRARQVVHTDDVLVSTTRPNLNSVAMVPSNLHGGICSTGFCVLRPKTFLSPTYLFLFVQSLEFVENVSSLVKGALYPAVTDRQVRAQFIPLPPLEEQKRIAAILNEQMAAMERARAAAVAQLDTAKALPATYLRAVFTNTAAHQWPITALGEAGKIVSGITLGRHLGDVPARPVPYLRVANVKDGYLDLSDVYEIQATGVEIEKLRLRFGDLLLTEGGDPDKLGRGTFWQEQIPECIHQNHIFRVRFDLNRFSPEFVAAQIGSPYGKAYFLARAKRTTGIATINQKVLAAFPLMVPPLAEQQSIVAQVNEQMAQAEKVRRELDDRLTAINALPAALLRRAFSGEL